MVLTVRELVSEKQHKLCFFLVFFLEQKSLVYKMIMKKHSFYSLFFHLLFATFVCGGNCNINVDGQCEKINVTVNSSDEIAKLNDEIAEGTHAKPYIINVAYMHLFPKDVTALINICENVAWNFKFHSLTKNQNEVKESQECEPVFFKFHEITVSIKDLERVRKLPSNMKKSFVKYNISSAFESFETMDNITDSINEYHCLTEKDKNV